MFSFTVTVCGGDKFIILYFFSRLNEYRPSKKRWDLSRMGKIEKNLYEENPKVTARSDVSQIALKLLGFYTLLLLLITLFTVE